MAHLHLTREQVVWKGNGGNGLRKGDKLIARVNNNQSRGGRGKRRKRTGPGEKKTFIRPSVKRGK